MYKILLTCLVLPLPFYLVISNEGWPSNHEWLVWVSRNVANVLHFRQWDLLPYWSSGEVWNTGGPLLLYYHKLYYYLCASLYILTGTLKVSTICSLILLSAVGVAGLYKTLRILNINSWIALLISLSLLFQYYTLTDWFIRGAFAEFSALMVAPWLIHWSVKFIKTNKFEINVAFILILLFLAHNVIAYYGIIFILLALAFVMLRPGISKSEIYTILKNGTISSLIFLSCMSVFLVPMAMIKGTYDPSRIKLEIKNTFVDFYKYIIDTDYNWSSWEGFTVMSSPVLLVLIATLLIFSIINRKEDLINWTRTGKFTFSKTSVFIIISLIVLFYLQSRLSYWFYLIVPGADYIQFPWRLLTYIQIFFLIAFSLLITKAFPENEQKNALFFSGFFLVIMIATYPGFRNTKPNFFWFKVEELENFKNNGNYGGGEYMPVLKTKPENEIEFYRILSEKGIEVSCSQPCKVEKLPHENPEDLHLYYKVEASAPAEIILPLNYSGLEVITRTDIKNPKLIKAYRTPDDPRIRLKIDAGTKGLHLILPNIWNLFRLAVNK